MFGPRYFGHRYYGPRYFGDGGSAASVGVSGNIHMRQMGYTQAAWRGFRSILFLLMGA